MPLQVLLEFPHQIDALSSLGVVASLMELPLRMVLTRAHSSETEVLKPLELRDVLIAQMYLLIALLNQECK